MTVKKFNPKFKYSVEIWSAALEAGWHSIRELCLRTLQSVLLKCRFVFGSSHTFPALGLVLIEDFGKRFDTLTPFVEQGIEPQTVHNAWTNAFLSSSHPLAEASKALSWALELGIYRHLNIMKVPVTQCL